MKIAVFGKPGGGKSTLSKRLSSDIGVTLYALDSIEFNKDGERVPAEEYKTKHTQLIAEDNWIIDGLGTLGSFWQRIEAADVLIYVDLPYPVHYWWVTKRLLKSFFAHPEGWPEGSSVLKGTIASWKTLRLCPKFWTPELFEKIKAQAEDKPVHRISSVKELKDFTGEQLV